MVESDAAQRVPPVGAPSETVTAAAPPPPQTPPPSSAAPTTPPPNESTAVDFVSNDQLDKEFWFHGPISRKEAESFVLKDGDFLVRESQNTNGQYVLTGMQNSARKHLLLVDPEGIVSLIFLPSSLSHSLHASLNHNLFSLFLSFFRFEPKIKHLNL